MNEVQINKIKKRADEYATSCFPYEKQFLEREAVVKCCVHVVTETIAELEKENAELKGIEDVATLIRANNDTVTTLMQLNNKLVSKNQQLTKAKEIIRALLKHTYGQNLKTQNDFDLYLGRIKEAEQFLNSEVEK